MSETAAPSSLRQQGIEALRGGQYDAAIEALSRVLMTHPADVGAQAWLGMAYSQKGLHPQANQLLDRAVQAQPGSAALHYNRGLVLERAGRPAEAVAAYQQTLKLNPQAAQAQQRLQALGQPASFAAPVPVAPAPVSPTNGVAGPAYGGMPGPGSPAPAMQAAAGFPSYNQPGAWGGASGSPASPAGSLGPPSPAAPSVGMAAAPQSVGRPASVGGKPAADAPEDQDNPVALILGGVLMLAGAVFCYFWLADKELHGGTIRMPVLALLLYELLGKWGVSGLVALVGIVILGRGIQRARQ